MKVGKATTRIVDSKVEVRKVQHKTYSHTLTNYQAPTVTLSAYNEDEDT